MASAKNGNKVEAVEAHASIRPDGKGRSMGLTRRVARSHRLMINSQFRPVLQLCFKDDKLICTLVTTWKEESPTAPSGVLDPGGVEEEEVTSGKNTLEYRSHDNK